MTFEWNEAKDRANLAKHGLSCEEARLIFAGPVLTARDDRFDYGEERWISIGAIAGLVVIVAVHTDRNGVTRLISARFANRKERQRYHEHLAATSESAGNTKQ